MNQQDPIRQRDPGGQPLVYLNTAAAGLLSPTTLSAPDSFGRGMLRNPGGAFMGWLTEGLPRLREKAAVLLGTNVRQVGFAPNFSFGFCSVVESLRDRVHRVLLFRDDYPSLNLPFELGGFEISYLESADGFSISLQEIKKILEQKKIEVLALSHVQFLAGFKIDVEALGLYCRSHGVVFLVDATQSMGAVPLHFDDLGTDVLISSSYKWLNGGYGSAVCCITEEFIRRFPPRIGGFASMVQAPGGWYYEPSIVSYEPGHLNIPGLLQLEEAIDARLKQGQDAVADHNRRLVQRLAEGISGTPFRIRGGAGSSDRAALLSFDADKKVHDYLVGLGFSVTWRRGLIRVSPHFYNTTAEIDSLVSALEQYG